jgi:hypothetical protein
MGAVLMLKITGLYAVIVHLNCQSKEPGALKTKRAEIPLL